MKLAFVCVCVGAACAGSAMGAISAVTGSATLIAPPTSAVLGANQSNTSAWAFNEGGPITLTAPLEVNVTTPGLYTNEASLTPGLLPVGMTVYSHYLYSDPVGGTVRTYEGSVEVDGPIVGIIVLRNRLNLTDALLGAPGTTYGDNSARGLELSLNADVFRLVVSGTRVDFHFETSGATDDIRILTIPSASVMSVAGAGLVALTRRRR